MVSKHSVSVAGLWEGVVGVRWGAAGVVGGGGGRGVATRRRQRWIIKEYLM